MLRIEYRLIEMKMLCARRKVTKNNELPAGWMEDPGRDDCFEFGCASLDDGLDVCVCVERMQFSSSDPDRASINKLLTEFEMASLVRRQITWNAINRSDYQLDAIVSLQSNCVQLSQPLQLNSETMPTTKTAKWWRWRFQNFVRWPNIDKQRISTEEFRQKQLSPRRW